MIIRPFSWQIENLKFHNPLKLDFSPYGIIGVAGPVGSGKSSFLKLFADFKLHSLKIIENYPFCAYLSQDLTRLFIGNTLELLLQVYSNPKNIIGKHFDIKAFWKYAQSLEIPLENKSAEPLLSFSEGELQRIAISLALASRAPLTILDEPTTALNPRYCKIFYRLLKNLKEESKILMVSHRLQDFRCCAEAVLIIENMTIQKLLPLQQFLENEIVNRYFPPDIEG